MTTKSPSPEQVEASHEVYDYTQGVPLDGIERFFQIGSPIFEEIEMPDINHPVIETCGLILDYLGEDHARAFQDGDMGVVFEKIGYHARVTGEHFVYGTYTTEEDGESYSNFFLAAFNRTPEHQDNTSPPDTITLHAWISGSLHTATDDAEKERDYFAPYLILVPFVDPEHPELIEYAHNDLDPQNLDNVCHCLLFLESALQTFVTGHEFQSFEIERKFALHPDPVQLIHEYLKKSTERLYASMCQEIQALKEGLDAMAGTPLYSLTGPEEVSPLSEEDASFDGPFESAIPQENLFGMLQLNNPDFFHLTENADITEGVFDILQNMLYMAECPATQDLHPTAPISNISLYFSQNDMNVIAAFVDYEFQGPDGSERRGILVAGQKEKFLENGKKIVDYRPYCVVAGQFYQPHGESTVLFKSSNVQIRFNQKPHVPGTPDDICFLDGDDHLMNGLCYADEVLQFMRIGCRLDTTIHQKWVNASDESVGEAFVRASLRSKDDYMKLIKRDAGNVYKEELGRNPDYRFFYPTPSYV